MTAINQLFDELRRAGVTLIREGDAIAIEGDDIPDRLIAEVRRMKPVIMRMLPDMAPPSTGMTGYLAPDLDQSDIDALFWLDTVSHPSQRWRTERRPVPPVERRPSHRTNAAERITKLPTPAPMTDDAADRTMVMVGG